MHKPGDTVAVTLIREARATTASVKLGEKEVAALWNFSGQTFVLSGVTDTDAPAEARGAKGSGVITLNVAAAAPPQDPAGWADVLGRLVRTGPVRLDDGELVAWAVNAGSDRYLVAAESATGKVPAFKGPITTDAQWNQVPEKIREKSVPGTAFNRRIRRSSGQGRQGHHPAGRLALMPQWRQHQSGRRASKLEKNRPSRSIASRTIKASKPWNAPASSASRSK